MCSMYWTLRTPGVECGSCHALAVTELQTHFMGEVGSCGNYYALGDEVAELQGVSAMMTGKRGDDDFIGGCDACDQYADYGAEVVAGRVLRVWLLPRVTVNAL